MCCRDCLLFELSIEVIDGKKIKFLDCEPNTGKEFKEDGVCERFKKNPRKRT